MNFYARKEWLDYRAACIKEADGVCKGCGKTDLLQVHHPTYIPGKNPISPIASILGEPQQGYAAISDKAECFFRPFFSLQYRDNARVACESQSRSWAAFSTSTAAKYFGAFAAGFPNGMSNFPAISAGISCS